jgi:hypothetical protein
MSVTRVAFLLVVSAVLGCGGHATTKMQSSTGSGGQGGATGGSGSQATGSGGAGGAANQVGGSGANGAPGNPSDGGVMHADDACGPVLHEPRCLRDGWCWAGPSVLGGDLFSVDATPDAKAGWAVGALGSAYRYCNGHWLAIETGVQDHLYDVFSPTPDFAVAVGANGTVIAWDGKAWKRVAMPTDEHLHAVWGASTHDIWIGGELPGLPRKPDNLFHFDGAAVTESFTSGSNIHAIRGRSTADVYAVGGWDLSGTADHWDGKAWTPGSVESREIGDVTAVIFGAKHRAYGLFDSRIVADDQPDWVSVFGMINGESLAGLYLDDSGSPAAIARTADVLMPGTGFKESDNLIDWVETADRFPILPAKIWTGAGKDWAAGAGNALIERGSDGTWSQVKDFDWMLGRPILLGGPAEDDLYFVSDYDTYHRDATGWKALPRSEKYIQAAAVDAAGHVYITTQDGAISTYDGNDWKVVNTDGHTGGTLAAFAPDDLWQGELSAARHWDGTAWVSVSTDCAAGYGSEAGHFVKAPDGKVWGVSSRTAFELDTAAGTCKVVVRPGDPDSNDPLVDLAWTDGGQLWAISRRGLLYRRASDMFELAAMPGVDPLPDGGAFDASKTFLVETLWALPGNKLRYLLGLPYYGVRDGFATGRLVTVDVGGSTPSASFIDVPVSGPLWVSPDAHTFVAFAGGVLRRED